MSTLIAALQTASNALRTFEKSVGVVQNNVLNASTPGYARQQLPLYALPFQPESGWYGGIQAGAVQSARNEFAESSVRGEVEQQGYQSTRASALQGVERAFDVTGKSSLSAAMNQLFSAFSAWSVSPNDAEQRQNVISAAGQFVASAKQTSQDLQANAAQMEQDIRSQVQAVNRLGAQIRSINESNIRNPAAATANDAELNATLEELAQYVNFTAVTASDGTTTVLIDGQEPLVMGDRMYALDVTTVACSSTNAPPQVCVIDSTGADITARVKGGSLGGAVSVRNGDLAHLLGNNTQRGSLNDLVFTLANTVNTLLQSGEIDEAGTPGVALFTVSSDATAADTIMVNTAIDASKLAAIDPGPPPVSNGIASKLAALVNDKTTMAGGLSFSDFYGSIAAEVGRNVDAAQTAATRQTQLVSQARSMRSDLSGVSLDEEAAKLTELQRAYEASSRVFTVVNELMDNLMNLIPQ